MTGTSMPKEPSFEYTHQLEFGKLEKAQHKPIQEISKAHIESFNFVLKEGLIKAVQNLEPEEFELPNKDRVKLEIRDALIGRPTLTKGSIQTQRLEVYPCECRNREGTYKGRLQIMLVVSKNGIDISAQEKIVGEVPVMVKSDVCNLNKLTPKQLVAKGEDAEEFGGYFVVNGNERIIRMLLLQKRNYPLAIQRPSWKNRGKMFSDYGVTIRCVRQDQTGANMVLHYLTTGTAQLMFSYKKELFFLPIVMVLKALCDVTDKFIYDEMIKGLEDNSFFKGCVANMLRQIQNEGLITHVQIKRYIGERFRIKTSLPEWYTDEQVTDFLFRQCIAIHLDSNADKFNLLVFMTRKLFAVARGECALENPDSPMNHEALLSGHLYLMVLKEKLQLWLNTLRQSIIRRAKSSGAKFELTQQVLGQCMGRTFDVGRAMEYLLSTGNLVSSTGLGLMQFSGLTILADRLNFHRFLSHFRSVHRGSFFAEMRTTTARKLLPEAWGFLCPVHTPDGSPCGLLNHMSATCEVTNNQPSVASLPMLLVSLGMSPYDLPCPFPIKESYAVLLDGKVLGWIPHSIAPVVVMHLRAMKAKGLQKVPETLEIGFVPATGKPSQYPGLFLSSTPARFMRPVLNLATNTAEMIGIFEQVYMNICVIPEEAVPGETTHQELSETGMLSVLAHTIPYSDFNQSPRNMYQCQMGKQTMGTPCHTFKFRSDNKLYRLQTPQSPLVRPAAYDHYKMDDYPSGTNAVVAVISYTGYDMEDAMILNKASLERGFKHASIYKTEFINLRKLAGEKGSQITYVFGRKESDTYLNNKIDMDGLPFIGNKVEQGDPICSYIDVASGVTKVQKYKSDEAAYIHEVKILGNDSGTDILQRIAITFWIPRNPIIGDKFASRHGQKGVCSQKWPMEDMPFTESGMTPDIIFNPHGFPSRMTIGMVIESMAGKSGALNGLVHDATPFRFSEKYPASDYFGELLEKAGYNYFGTERMYSGVDGRELNADIFFGVVYYQRLRHMVSDKFQVRTTGPVDIITHQPVKGRKKKGGIRFGEMERDSLLAHGTAFLLHDRLFNCSDKSLAYVCRACGSILSPIFERGGFTGSASASDNRWFCKTCDNKDPLDVISIPYVFRYLVAELAAINLKVRLEVK